MAERGSFRCPSLVRERKFYAVWGIKGGVGKSTVSALLAHASSNITGTKTLLIDTDFRDGSSRFFLGEKARTLEGWYDVLVKGGRLERYVHTVTPMLSVIPPGSLDSAVEYSSLIQKKGIRYVVRLVANALVEIQAGFDRVFLDFPVTSFTDIPILKCSIEALSAHNIIITQASIPEIERTLKLVKETLGVKPFLLVVNQLHPLSLADVKERRLFLSSILKIVRDGIKVMPIPFTGELYRTINWNSQTVRAIEECLSFLLWGRGNPRACTFATRGLYEPETAKMVASLSSSAG